MERLSSSINDKVHPRSMLYGNSSSIYDKAHPR